MEQVAVTVSERFCNIADSKVPIQGKYKRNIVELARATFRTRFRTVSLNRKDWRFDILVVDADENIVKEFITEYPMCHIENTFSKE